MKVIPRYYDALEDGLRELFWLDDEAWAAIQPYLPLSQPGARRGDDRRIIRWDYPCAEQRLPLGRTARRGIRAGLRQRSIATSKGGQTTKIHLLSDTPGRPIIFKLTAGNVSDITTAEALLAEEGNYRYVLARWYDTNGPKD